MKVKNCLLAICTLFITVQSHAQIIDKVKTLFFSYGNAEFPFVISDSVNIVKNINDTIWFHTSNNYPSGLGIYFCTQKRVYKIVDTNPVLYFDYNLQEHQFFQSDINGYAETFIVDSVYYRKFNHRTFKAWHLTRTTQYPIRMEWIEGLGEVSFGWDTKQYVFTDGGWRVEAICLNDSLLYWGDHFNYFKDRTPSPTCSFDSLAKKLQVQELTTSEKVIVYPNPSNEIVNIKFNTPQTGQLLAYSAIGQLVYSLTFENEEQLKLILPGSLSGLISLNIQTAIFTTTKMLVVNKE